MDSSLLKVPMRPELARLKKKKQVVEQIIS